MLQNLRNDLVELCQKTCILGVPAHGLVAPPAPAALDSIQRASRRNEIFRCTAMAEAVSARFEAVEAEILRYCEEETVVLPAVMSPERLCFCLAFGDLRQHWDKLSALVDQNSLVVESRFAHEIVVQRAQPKAPQCR